MRSVHVVLVLGLLLLAAWQAAAQQVTVTTPNRTIGDSFFERTGTHWGFNWKGANFTFGGPNMAVPPFGNFDPAAGINSGFAVRGNDFNGFFNWSAGQGYRQSMVTQAPSVTLTNGNPGFISDTSQSPFVISYIPIVGGFPTIGYLNPMTAYPGYSMAYPGNWRVQAMRGQTAGSARPAAQPAAVQRAAPAAAHRPLRARPPRPDADDDLNLVRPGTAPPVARPAGPAQRLATAQSSSAGRAVPSVVEARRLHQREQASADNEVMVLYERGRTAEEGGKPQVAKIYYGMAVRRATGEFRRQIQARLDALSSPGTP